jgi:hypothetical protein
MSTPELEVADVIRAYGAAFRRDHRLPRHHLRVLSAIEQCRTAALGGHVERCDKCEYERISYNSCRNRHCPKCGALAREKWLAARKEELLPVPYFHIVFTLPDDLNDLAQINQREVYTILFRTASETLLTLARQPRHLGAEIGLIAVLHTWGQTLVEHPHLHCIVPGGGLSSDGRRWIGSRENFFIAVHVLSRVFRGKFLERLKKAYRAGELKCIGRTKHLSQRETFQQLLDRLYSKGWVVYAKQPFGGPEQVLAYLGRYTHRVAISNHRLVSMKNGTVTFQWRDYRDESPPAGRAGKTKLMTLEAQEFLRRFLLHVLPERFSKIRYYGILSSRRRGSDLTRCKLLLGMSPEQPLLERKPWQELLRELTGIDIRQCPHCHEGRMVNVRELAPHRTQNVQVSGP